MLCWNEPYKILGALALKQGAADFSASGMVVEQAGEAYDVTFKRRGPLAQPITAADASRLSAAGLLLLWPPGAPAFSGRVCLWVLRRGIDATYAISDEVATAGALRYRQEVEGELHVVVDYAAVDTLRYRLAEKAYEAAQRAAAGGAWAAAVPSAKHAWLLSPTTEPHHVGLLSRALRAAGEPETAAGYEAMAAKAMAAKLALPPGV